MTNTAIVTDYEPQNSAQSSDNYTVTMPDGSVVTVARFAHETHYWDVNGNAPEIEEDDDYQMIDEAVAAFDEELRAEFRARDISRLQREAAGAALARVAELNAVHVAHPDGERIFIVVNGAETDCANFEDAAFRWDSATYQQRAVGGIGMQVWRDGSMIRGGWLVHVKEDGVVYVHPRALVRSV